MEIKEYVYQTENLTVRNLLGPFAPQPFHRHMNWEFVLLPDGDSDHYIDENSFLKLPPYSILAISDSALHLIHSRKSTHRHTDIYISDALLKNLCSTLYSDGLYASLSTPSNAAITLSQKEYSALADRLHEIEPIENVQVKKNLIQNVILQILSYYYQRNLSSASAPPEWLRDFVNAIQSPDVFCLPMDEIRALSHYSKSLLNVLLKKFYYATLSEYVNKLRLNYAKNLLIYSDKSILEVANMLNYDSLSHFIVFFKKATGKTPLKYRQEKSTVPPPPPPRKK